MVTERYDVIIGTGAGGGTLAHTLARSGKKIPLLERGDFLPREMDNWDPEPVFVDGKYITHDTWYDADGKPFQPQVHYCVGWATKMYAAALEDLPKPENRVTLGRDGNVHLAYTQANDAEAAGLYKEVKTMLNQAGLAAHHILDKNYYMKMDVALAGVAHQSGTCRFGAARTRRCST